MSPTEKQIEAAARAGSPSEFRRMESSFEMAKKWRGVLDKGGEDAEDIARMADDCDRKGKAAKDKLFAQYRDALTAAEAQEVKPRVKPLNWEYPIGYGSVVCRAETGMGIYSIHADEDSAGGRMFCELHLTQEADCTRWAVEIFSGYLEDDEIKEKAQADYEARVLSALEVSS